jgi:hypothetical protein
MQSYGIIGVTLWRNFGISTGKRQYPYVETVVSCRGNCNFQCRKRQFPAWKREVNVYNKLLPSWRISLCKVYTVLQILYLQPICRRYLQRSNYLSTSTLHAFRCRWQMFSCFFNFMVGGLRIKIRVTTISHKTNSPLCPPCPLW